MTARSQPVPDAADHPVPSVPGVPFPPRPSVPSTGRRAVVLTGCWSEGGEDAWFVRQVAGALAGVADVHVVTTEGTTAVTRADSVFTVHELARPVGHRERLRHALLREAFAATRRSMPRSTSADLAAGAEAHWAGVDGVMAGIQPDLVVVAGSDGTHGLRLAGGATDDASVALLPLLHAGVPAGPASYDDDDDVLSRVRAMLTATPGERDAAGALPVDPGVVTSVGLPLRADPNVGREPNTYVGKDDYVLVLVGSARDAADQRAHLARLVRLACPGRTVAIASTDAFEVWRQGQSTAGWAIERSGDVLRLMAWASVVVDLRPGPLFARSAIESLLHGTPIVVPEESAARQHAAAGGGLWFASPQELLECLDTLGDPGVRTTLGDQGREEATRHYGTTEAFVGRVLSAVGWG